VTDVAGNSATCSFSVTVKDTEPPTLTSPADITVAPTGPNGAVVTFTVTATDNCSVASIVCNPVSGSVFPIGTTNVAVTATDGAGNTASKTFKVTVLADIVLNGPLSDNGGLIKGSVQQLAGKPVTLNGGASITGDLLVPGTPSVVKNGSVTMQGTKVGTGSSQPTGYTVTLNGPCSLRYLRTRTDPATMPTVALPPAPTGTRSVTLTAAGQNPGDFATIRNLTLNGNVGQVIVPPGTYGNFTVNGAAGFTFGTAGSTQPTVYNLQNLTLNSTAQIVVAGPVVVVLANGLTANGKVGISTQPAWLQLKIASGGVTLKSGCTLAGLVTAPSGTVTINGNSQLIGSLKCNQLTINASGVLQGIGN
jgi:hypothetical protein